MSDLFQFIVDRYNYWIVIILMMTGLYIVIARGNLMKKIVGLNIFQTSVFIFYISIGKIAGGTAPILLGDAAHGGGHEEAPHGADDHGGAPAHAEPSTLHDAPGANDLGEAAASTAQAGPAPAGGLHDAPGANNQLATPPAGFDVTPAKPPVADTAADIAHQTAEVIYSNPLPHVLILTAIVVGVATTAVALALAVRIREAYGTIEEDELEAADDIAEFGHDFSDETLSRGDA